MMKTKKFSLRLPKGRDISIQLAMIGLMLIGLLMSGSSAMTSDVVLYALMIAWVKQAVFLAAGYLGYVWLSKHFSMTFVRDNFLWFIVLSFIGVIIPLFFHDINGARAWIQLDFGFVAFTIQPSEFIKLISILVLVLYMGDVKKKGATLGDLVKMPLFYVLGMVAIIAFAQSDLGSSLVLLGICVLVFMVASEPSLRAYQWLALFVMILAIAAIGFLLTPGGLTFLKGLHFIPDYMIKRFENTINPFINRYGTGYQLVSSLMAFVKGDWFGVGFGKSLQKYGYLPEAQTDFILAVIAEEFGFFGVILVSGLTLFIVVKLFIHAFKAKTDTSKMIFTGIAYYLLLHFILNVGGVTALIPLTGVPLLLISSGGSSTLSIMFGLGIAQRQISLSKTEVPKP
jgi:cell division protein FtsW